MSGRPSEEKIHYVCQRCGNCCRQPGEVHLTDAETLAIANHLALSPHEFTANYTRLSRNRQGLTLADQPGGACIFLRDNRCLIQSVKPQQCRDFPNGWTIPGWRDFCQAIPVRINPDEQQPATRPD